MNFPDFEKFNLNIKTDKQFWSFKTLPIHAKEECWPEVCRRAQLECARETLEVAAKNGKVKWVESESYRIVDEQSILDEANIKLIQ